MYLVTGATGNIGSEVVRALLAAGEHVRAVVHAATGAEPIPSDAEIAVGDLDDAGSLTSALDGVTGIFLLPGYRGAEELVIAAEKAGVRKLVQLSGSSAESRDMTNAITAYMVRSEDIATGSGLDWTILRPSAFMTNTYRWREQLRAGNEIRLPFPTLSTAVLDPADIGAVAAAALTDDAHTGRIHRLTGPEALTPAQQVKIVAQELGRTLTFVGQNDDDAHAEMMAQMPAAYVDAFFDFYVRGSLDESLVLPTVSDILGRPATRYAEWVHTHAEDLRG
jgi:uncharacterized protein YbjT (DUF2867 family)